MIEIMQQILQMWQTRGQKRMLQMLIHESANVTNSWQKKNASYDASLVFSCCKLVIKNEFNILHYFLVTSLQQEKNPSMQRRCFNNAANEACLKR
jgi:hypothetical protein